MTSPTTVRSTPTTALLTRSADPVPRRPRRTAGLAGRVTEPPPMTRAMVSARSMFGVGTVTRWIRLARCVQADCGEQQLHRRSGVRGGVARLARDRRFVGGADADRSARRARRHGTGPVATSWTPTARDRVTSSRPWKRRPPARELWRSRHGARAGQAPRTSSTTVMTASTASRAPEIRRTRHSGTRFCSHEPASTPRPATMVRAPQDPRNTESGESVRAA